jgi:hypothetical protein
MLSSVYWTRVWRALSERFELIAPDTLGPTAELC